MAIGERIKMYRERFGMSQEELALRAGYTDRSSVARIESGERELTQSKIEKFAEALRISPAELCGWTDTADVIDKQNPFHRLECLLIYMGALNLNCLPIDDEFIESLLPMDADPSQYGPEPEYRIYDAEESKSYYVGWTEMNRRSGLIADITRTIIKTKDDDLLYLYKYVSCLNDELHEVETLRHCIEGILHSRTIN